MSSYPDEVLELSPLPHPNEPAELVPDSSVATGSYPVATDEIYTKEDIQTKIYINAYKNANSSISSWEKKKKSKATKRNILRFQAIMVEAECELKKRGVDINDLFVKRKKATST